MALPRPPRRSEPMRGVCDLQERTESRMKHCLRMIHRSTRETARLSTTSMPRFTATLYRIEMRIVFVFNNTDYAYVEL